MAETSSIEWTDATWNPVTGCSVVSSGCTNCYAMRLAGTRLRNHPSRVGLTRDTKAGPVWTGEVRLNEEWLWQPLEWTRPRRIFVCAHGDLFHEGVPDGWIMRVLNVMGSARHHTFQVLTKRSDRMRRFFEQWADVNEAEDLDFKGARGPEAVRVAHRSGRGQLFAAMLDAMGKPPPGAAYPLFDWAEGMSRWPRVLPNVWLGVSAEDQRRADERVPDLLATPAAVRFVSMEPLLGSVDLTRLETFGDGQLDALRGVWACYPIVSTAHGAAVVTRDLSALNWVIAGGESGPGARPMHPDWARSLRDQCASADVSFHFKQWGAWLDQREATAKHCAPTSDMFDAEGRPTGDRWHFYDPDDPIGGAMIRIGKKAAGRLLDGVEHNGMPKVRA